MLEGVGLDLWCEWVCRCVCLGRFVQVLWVNARVCWCRAVMVVLEDAGVCNICSNNLIKIIIIYIVIIILLVSPLVVVQ